MIAAMIYNCQSCLLWTVWRAKYEVWREVFGNDAALIQWEFKSGIQPGDMFPCKSVQMDEASWLSVGWNRQDIYRKIYRYCMKTVSWLLHLPSSSAFCTPTPPNRGYSRTFEGMDSRPRQESRSAQTNPHLGNTGGTRPNCHLPMEVE